jgi:hypothetical protein
MNTSGLTADRNGTRGEADGRVSNGNLLLLTHASNERQLIHGIDAATKNALRQKRSRTVFFQAPQHKTLITNGEVSAET